MNIKRKYVYSGIANIISLIIFLVLLFILKNLADTLETQQMALRWQSDDVKYTQSSLFLPNENGLSIEDIYMNRINIDKRLSENSIEKSSVRLPDGTEIQNGRLWIDAFSGTGKLNAASDKISAEAETVFTGGDFFLFHPYILKSGSFYSDSDIMSDRIVIDEALAWQLFGSSDVNGMPVKVNGIRYFIAGVIEGEGDEASKEVYGEKPRMFMPYSSAAKMNPDIKITCYEVCLPNPVQGIGHNIFTETINADESKTTIIENSSRYTLKSIFDIIINYDKSTIGTKAVIYPYWENAARIIENKSALLLSVMLIMLILPVLTILYLLYRLIKARKKIAGKIKDKLKNIYGVIKSKRRTVYLTEDKV